jgi:hypothetical protein
MAHSDSTSALFHQSSPSASAPLAAEAAATASAYASFGSALSALFFSPLIVVVVVVVVTLVPAAPPPCWCPPPPPKSPASAAGLLVGDDGAPSTLASARLSLDRTQRATAARLVTQMTKRGGLEKVEPARGKDGKERGGC